MTFEEYLISKKIEGDAFHKADAELWNEFKSHFDQQHPKSFTYQKLFLINGLRKMYPLKAEEKAIINPEKKISRPVFKKKNLEGKESELKPKPVIKSKPVIKKDTSENPEDVTKKVKPIMKRPKMK